MKDYETEKTFRKIDKFGIQLLIGFGENKILCICIWNCIMATVWKL
mgnify:CR=1 FL=1